jgi:hypothetical protein
MNPVDQRFAAACKVEIAGWAVGYGQMKITFPRDHHGIIRNYFPPVDPFKVM